MCRLQAAAPAATNHYARALAEFDASAHEDEELYMAIGHTQV